MKARDFVSCALHVIFTCCLAAGCQSARSQRGMLERQVNDAQLSSHQLRVMVNEFVIHFTDRVELRADQILANTSDPAIRKNALLWKINGISACFQAASRSDPLGAYLDIWILNRQMTQFFESPAGNQLFGPGQAIALDECHSLERRLQGIDQAVGGDISLGDIRLGENFVANFAADFPVTSLYFDREPIASRYIQEVREPANELMQVVANLDSSVDELKQLSITYAKHLPKQARWEAELFLIDSTQLAVIQRPLQDFSSAAGAVSRIAYVTEAIPSLVERERDALRDIVVDERQQTLRELDRMRAETLVQLEGERSVVLDALREERLAVLEALSGERIAVSRDLQTETTRALQATDVITRRRAEELVQQAPRLVDHFFWRAWQLGIAFAVVAAALAWLVLRAKRQPANNPITLALPESPAEHISSYDDGELKKAA